MDSSFYVGHKQTVLHPNEVLISVLIPLTRKVNMEMPCGGCCTLKAVVQDLMIFIIVSLLHYKLHL